MNISRIGSTASKIGRQTFEDAENAIAAENAAALERLLAVDTSTPNGRLLSAIMAAVSRHERDQRSETTKDALAVLKRRGIPITNRIGYVIAGSKHGKTDTRHYAADHTRQMIGRKAAQLFRQGYSRDEVRILLRPAKTINGNKDFGTTSLTQLAAAACLEFPMIGMQELSELLGMKIATLEFVRLPKSEHEACIQKICEYAWQQRDLAQR